YAALLRARPASHEPGGDAHFHARALEQLRERATGVGPGDGVLELDLVDPVRPHDDLDPRAHDLMALSLDLVHHDRAIQVVPTRRRTGRSELAGDRHGQATAVRRGEQLLGARLASRSADAGGERERQPREGAALRIQRARAASEVAV